MNNKEGVITINIPTVSRDGLNSSKQSLPLTIDRRIEETLQGLTKKFQDLDEGFKNFSDFFTTKQLKISTLQTGKLLTVDQSQIIGHANLKKFINGTDEQININETTDGNIILSLPQSLSTQSIPIFSNIVISGQPNIPSHVVTKGYIDSVLQSHTWEKTIKTFYDPILILPNDPFIGDRYISTSESHGWLKNRIYEYTGNNWNETYPNTGLIVSVGNSNIKEPEFLSQHNLNHLLSTHIFDGYQWVPFGRTIDHIDLINTGSYDHSSIDKHIENKKIHLSNNEIDHYLIHNTGKYTHSQIDKHINNISNAHFGQDLSKNGTPEFKHIKLVDDSTMSYHAVSKGYVDSKINGLTWKKHVDSYYDPTVGLPINPMIGVRYISLISCGSWIKDHIYEFDGTDWIDFEPILSYAVYVEGGVINSKSIITYNGAEWIKFGATYDHDTLEHCGVYSHILIDDHINNNKNAHFGQDLQKTGSPIFKELSIDESIYSHKCHINQINSHESFTQCPNDFNLDKNGLSKFSIIGNNITDTNIMLYCADGNSTDPINIMCIRGGGSLHNPKALKNGMSISSLTSIGFDGIAYQITSSIQTITTEDFTSTNHGTGILISTTKNGTNKPYVNFKFDHDGTLYGYSLQESVSPCSGSLVIRGGVGIGKRLFTGTDVCIGKNIYFTGSSPNPSILPDTLPGLDNKVLQLGGGGDTLPNRGATITLTGVNSLLGGRLILNAGSPNGNIVLNTNGTTRLTITQAGQCLVNSQIKSNNFESGSLVVNGGVGIKEKLYIGGSQIYLHHKNNAFICSDTQTGQDDSRISLCGGGNASTTRGGQIITFGNQHQTYGGNIFIYAGQTPQGSIRFATGDTTIERGNINAQGVWNITSEINSTEINNGSLVVGGGVGVSGNVNVGGILTSKDRFRVAPSSIEPPNPVGGDMYYDTISNTLRLYITDIGWKTVGII